MKNTSEKHSDILKEFKSQPVNVLKPKGLVGTKSVRVISVIETTATKQVDEQVTITHQYWSFDGTLLAENDGINRS